MIRKIYLILLTAFMVVPLMAQPRQYVAEDYLPKSGQWQVSLIAGSSSFLNDNLNSFLVPSSTGAIGLPNSGTDSSGDLSTYLNIEGFNSSRFTLVGLQTKCFLTDHYEINLSFGVNIDLTPSRDYVEGDATISDMVIPEQQYINAQSTHNWYVTLGSNRYFTLKNPRVHPYVGLALTYQMARLVTKEPYIGDNEEGDDLHMYQSGTNIGQTMSARGAIVAGLEYSLCPGLVLGFEFHPVSYRFDFIQIAPRSFDVFSTSHHSVRVFEMPVLKLGIRF